MDLIQGEDQFYVRIYPFIQYHFTLEETGTLRYTLRYSSIPHADGF